jgi:DNA-binding transcriptional LysR family regulator
MRDMSEVYGRDLDLNLLRVFVVVGSTGSVTRAAAQLYLTQPAVSAALARLSRSVGAPLFARSGRGLVLTPRGQSLFDSARPLLQALVDATLSPPQFDPLQSERVIRLGLSDGMEGWLLPRLLRAFQRTAPHMRLVAVPVQFRTVADALSSQALDLAVSVADELPPSIERTPMLRTRFVCLFDPRQVSLGARVSEREYFAHEHVIVSYNADLRGIIEDMFQKQRRVRCSVASFSHIGALVQDTPLLATVPEVVAVYMRQLFPKLAIAELPFRMQNGGPELLWLKATADDAACQFVRERVLEVAKSLTREGEGSRSGRAARKSSDTG